MTLPDTPFVCENIDVEASGNARLESGYPARRKVSERDRIAIVAAALGEVIPAEVDKRGHLQPHPTKEMIDEFRYTEQRYRTPWQPVVSDKE
jgi:hypothetical protein